MVRLTHGAWLAAAEKRYGPILRHVRFRCPACGYVQSGQDFLDAGIPLLSAAMYSGFSCIGRFLSSSRAAFAQGPGPCNFTSGGLIRLAPIIVTLEDGSENLYFDFADQPLVAEAPLATA